MKGIAVNVHLDPSRLDPQLDRLAALAGATAPARASGPQGPGLGPIHEILGTLATVSPVRRRMDELAAACAAYASGAALAGRAADLDADLTWLHRELQQVAAAAVHRARTLGVIDAERAADLAAVARAAA